VSEAAGIKKGDSIIDVCAAPGGKSLHAACKLNGTGHVEARDLTDYKVELIRQNMERVQYTNIEAVQADALVYQEEKKETADIVFADLPCSGLGVIGKKRDIKYRISEKALTELAALQRSILEVVQNYVKPGGTLIYSTCTINRLENEEMVQWFTKKYAYELESLDPYIPQKIRGNKTVEGYLQLLPGIHETDGFFIARLKKKRG
jgi:16S rRNA (cytosine967-C5)-methyltransferase